MKKLKLILIVVLALALTACAGGPDEQDTFDDIDDLVSAAAWEVVDLLAEDNSGWTLVVSYFTEDGEKSDLSDFLISGLTTEIANAAAEDDVDLTVVSRDSLDRILEELSFQMSDLAAKDSQQKIGQQTGAELILTGTITEFDSEYKVHGQLVEIETGEVLGGFSLSLTE